LCRKKWSDLVVSCVKRKRKEKAYKKKTGRKRIYTRRRGSIKSTFTRSKITFREYKELKVIYKVISKER
jgi:hypothetical protein